MTCKVQKTTKSNSDTSYLNLANGRWAKCDRQTDRQTDGIKLLHQYQRLSGSLVRALAATGKLKRQMQHAVSSFPHNTVRLAVRMSCSDAGEAVAAAAAAVLQ